MLSSSSSSSEYETLVKNVKANAKSGSVVVIKYGGHAMENDELKELFCKGFNVVMISISIYKNYYYHYFYSNNNNNNIKT